LASFSGAFNPNSESWKKIVHEDTQILCLGALGENSSLGFLDRERVLSFLI
jgi:hypothetical protein